MKNEVYELLSLPGLSVMDNGGGVGWTMTDSPVSAAYWTLERLSGEKYLHQLPALQVSVIKIFDKRN